MLRLVVAAALLGAAARAEQLWVRKPRSRSAFLVDGESLGALCERHGLELDQMRAVAKGERRHCRGWCCGPIEPFEADPAAAVTSGDDALFSVETTVIGQDGVARSMGEGADAAAAVDLELPAEAEEEGEEEEGDVDEIVAASAAADDEDDEEDDDIDEDEDEDEDEDGAAEPKRTLTPDAAAGTKPGGLFAELLRNGQGFPVILSPLVTLALAFTDKKITTDIRLARKLFYVYCVLFFGATSLMQGSIRALPDDAEDEETRVEVTVPPSPADMMQAAMSGSPPPQPEATFVSRRQYDAAELAKLRQAVLSGAVLNLGLSFVMKKRGASILIHRSIVGAVELALHPLLRAHVLPQTGVLAGAPLTRVRRPFPPPLNLVELLAKGQAGAAGADAGGASSAGALPQA